MKKINEDFLNLNLHEVEVFFKKNNTTLIGYFLLGGCHYLWNSSFFSWLPNYNQEKDGLMLLKVTFLEYKDFKIKCEDSLYEFPPRKIFIDNNEFSGANFFSITGDLDGELYEEVSVEFDYSDSIIEFEYTTNEEYDNLIKMLQEES